MAGNDGNDSESPNRNSCYLETCLDDNFVGSSNDCVRFVRSRRKSTETGARITVPNDVKVPVNGNVRVPNDIKSPGNDQVRVPVDNKVPGNDQVKSSVESNVPVADDRKNVNIKVRVNDKIRSCSSDSKITLNAKNKSVDNSKIPVNNQVKSLAEGEIVNKNVIRSSSESKLPNNGVLVVPVENIISHDTIIKPHGKASIFTSKVTKSFIGGKDTASKSSNLTRSSSGGKLSIDNKNKSDKKNNRPVSIAGNFPRSRPGFLPNHNLESGLSRSSFKKKQNSKMKSNINCETNSLKSSTDSIMESVSIGDNNEKLSGSNKDDHNSKVVKEKKKGNFFSALKMNRILKRRDKHSVESQNSEERVSTVIAKTGEEQENNEADSGVGEEVFAGSGDYDVFAGDDISYDGGAYVIATKTSIENPIGSVTTSKLPTSQPPECLVISEFVVMEIPESTNVLNDFHDITPVSQDVEDSDKNLKNHSVNTDADNGPNNLSDNKSKDICSFNDKNADSSLQNSGDCDNVLHISDDSSADDNDDTITNDLNDNELVETYASRSIETKGKNTITSTVKPPAVNKTNVELGSNSRASSRQENESKMQEIKSNANSSVAKLLERLAENLNTKDYRSQYSSCSKSKTPLTPIFENNKVVDGHGEGMTMRSKSMRAGLSESVSI